MKVFTLERSQDLPITMEEAWDFFSSPQNLKIMTPPDMGFDILTDLGEEKMYAGQIIWYKVTPVFGISMHWVTEITHVNEPHYFVDEQRFGPYSMWHHKHFLEAIEGGVRMRDVVHYVLPLGILGRIANSFYVKRKLNAIFEFRRLKLIQIFAK